MFIQSGWVICQPSTVPTWNTQQGKLTSTWITLKTLRGLALLAAWLKVPGVKAPLSPFRKWWDCWCLVMLKTSFSSNKTAHTPAEDRISHSTWRFPWSLPTVRSFTWRPIDHQRFAWLYWLLDGSLFIHFPDLIDSNVAEMRRPCGRSRHIGQHRRRAPTRGARP